IVPVNGDSVVEANEQFTVTLSNATSASAPGIVQGTATGVIENDDQTVVPNFAVSTTQVDSIKFEGNSGQTNFLFTVTRTGDITTNSSVNYVLTGNSAFTGPAANQFDFVGNVLPF